MGAAPSPVTFQARDCGELASESPCVSSASVLPALPSWLGTGDLNAHSRPSEGRILSLEESPVSAQLSYLGHSQDPEGRALRALLCSAQTALGFASMFARHTLRCPNGWVGGI
jgi:hypothetical protein